MMLLQFDQHRPRAAKRPPQPGDAEIEALMAKIHRLQRVSPEHVECLDMLVDHILSKPHPSSGEGLF